MKHIETSYRPEFRLALTNAEINRLRYLASAHYDSVCKGTGMQGGVLVRITNIQHGMGTDPTEYNFTWREIDTLAKVSEMEHYLITKEKDAMYLLAKFNRLMTQYKPITTMEGVGEL